MSNTPKASQVHANAALARLFRFNKDTINHKMTPL